MGVEKVLSLGYRAKGVCGDWPSTHGITPPDAKNNVIATHPPLLEPPVRSPCIYQSVEGRRGKFLMAQYIYQSHVLGISCCPTLKQLCSATAS